MSRRYRKRNGGSRMYIGGDPDPIEVVPGEFIATINSQSVVAEPVIPEVFGEVLVPHPGDPTGRSLWTQRERADYLENIIRTHHVPLKNRYKAELNQCKKKLEEYDEIQPGGRSRKRKSRKRKSRKRKSRKRN